VQERLASTHLDGGLASIPEASHEHDFDSEVEFDLLSGDTSDNELFSAAVYPYSVFKVPLGSVRNVSSTYLLPSDQHHDFRSFDVIIDSGCTRHMFCFRELFF
jgi:hypothetical protein